MTPLEFKAAWICEVGPVLFELVQFPQEAVSTLEISLANRDFLANIGLPKDAAPMLLFGSKRVLNLPTVSELMGLKTSFNQLRVIGFNNFGEPICIDEANGGRIVYLFHDGPPESRFMNSSVAQLAYSLLAFRRAVEATNKAGGRGLDLIPPEVKNEFIRAMNDIDAAAIQPDLFWSQSIQLQ